MASYTGHAWRHGEPFPHSALNLNLAQMIHRYIWSRRNRTPPPCRESILQAPNARDSIFGLKGTTVPRRLGNAGRRTRALVCAPSNSALDEIVMRLLGVGLRGADGAMYKPTVVRVGVHVHHSVAHVSLDKLVDDRLAASVNKVCTRMTEVESAAVGPRLCKPGYSNWLTAWTLGCNH